MQNEGEARGGSRAAEEEAELRAVLASESFSRAPALARMLDYIGGEYFAGRAEALREYSIGVQALGRREDFNPAEDSSVRVGVSRIRKRLERYYEGEGRGHRLRMSISGNGYVPEFRVNGGAEREGRVDVARGAKWGRWVALGVGLAVLVAGAGWEAARWTGGSRGAGAAEQAAAVVSEGDTVRLMVGSKMPKYVDASGRVWTGDRYYEGGEVVSRPAARVLRTLDIPLYQQARVGDFSYRIPLKAGRYELHLHFAEILLQGSFAFGREGMRRFHVKVNGQPVLTDFDIALDAPGLQVADERVFTGVGPAQDGRLHVELVSSVGRAMLSGIEVRPMEGETAAAVRIVTRYKGHYDQRGNFWEADRYSQGGTASMRPVPVTGEGEPALFGSERFGSFSYNIPVAEGRYRVKLWFAESSFGTEESSGAGRRLFDIFCNGVALSRGVDVWKEAGAANRALAKEYGGLRPNAQGKLVLDFVPVREAATVRAIEVVPEGR